jgi:hypothetical protein
MKIGVVPAQEASFSDVLIYFLPKLRFPARDEIDCMGHLRRKPCLLVNRSALPPLLSSAAAGCGHCRCWQGANVCKHHNLTWFERDHQSGRIAANFRLEKIKILNLFHS